MTTIFHAGAGPKASTYNACLENLSRNSSVPKIMNPYYFFISSSVCFFVCHHCVKLLVIRYGARSNFLFPFFSGAFVFVCCLHVRSDNVLFIIRRFAGTHIDLLAVVFAPRRPISAPVGLEYLITRIISICIRT